MHSHPWVGKVGMALALLVILQAAPPASAEVIYSNTTTSTGFFLPLPVNNIVEAGDEVLLAGSARSVTQFSLPIFNNIVNAQGHQADITLRFYAGGAAPGPGTQIGAPITVAGVMFPTGTTTVTFDVPGYSVPDNLIWTIGFSNVIGPGFIGPRTFDPPTIGSSGDFVWQNDGSGFVMTDDPNIVDNFGAEITATIIPEPGSLSLLTVGTLALLSYGWRRRKAA